MRCQVSDELLGAYFDSELDAVRSEEIALHERSCANCAARLANLRTMRSGLASLRLAAPELLRRRVLNDVTAALTRKRVVPSHSWLAVAASLVLAFLLGRWANLGRPGPNLSGELVAAHLRSLEADHLLDIASTDRHSVKPWFDGKVDFVPPVQDFAEQGFPLVGGRLDYVNGRPVAAVVYRRGKHVINVFSWPSSGRGEAPLSPESVRGYNLVGWTHSGIRSWAVSDVNAQDLAVLSRLLRGPG
jgi:anti-sigma factor RsiW